MIEVLRHWSEQRPASPPSKAAVAFPAATAAEARTTSRVAADGVRSPGAAGALGPKEELWENGLSSDFQPDARGRYSDPVRGGCGRWPEHLRLVSEHGQVVRGRCRSTNQCDYCAKLTARENCEMLALDACEGQAPELWCVLGTRIATTDTAAFYPALKEVMRRLRAIWPAAEYASLLEYTTGYGPRADGERRPHWNLLIKGIPGSARKRAREVIVSAWCDNVPRVPVRGWHPPMSLRTQAGAEPGAQLVKTVHEFGGLARYIALHFQKESQRPPQGFRGQRFNCSRGYFTGRTRAEMRELARDVIRDRQLRHKAEQALAEAGDTRDQAVELDDQAREHGTEVGWLAAWNDRVEDFIDAQFAREGLPAWGVYQMPTPSCERDHCSVSAVPVRQLEAAFKWRDREADLAEARAAMPF